MRLATFNLENLDDAPDGAPPLAERLRILRPQLERLAADVLCLQEVNAQRDGPKAKVCKTFIGGSIPPRASNISPPPRGPLCLYAR